MHGYIHIYTGDGKGKTTAALGLIVRAAGAGLSICLIQFLKSGDYSEIQALHSSFPSVHIEQFGRKRRIGSPFTPEDRDLAESGMQRAAELIGKAHYDVVILDEINLVLHNKLLAVEKVTQVLTRKPDSVEVVLTGRYAPEVLYGYAHLITEMKAVKHYIQQGVTSRRGIEK